MTTPVEARPQARVVRLTQVCPRPPQANAEASVAAHECQYPTESLLAPLRAQHFDRSGAGGLEDDYELYGESAPSSASK